jgi:hypothetical protein
MPHGSGAVARNARLRSEFGADRHSTLSLGTLYFALLRGNPNIGGVEPDATGSYARVAATNNGTLWGTITSGMLSVSNAVAIEWPTATALYSITAALDHWAIYDNNSGGVLWYWGPLSTLITVTGAGDVPRLPIGTLTVTAPE